MKTFYAVTAGCYSDYHIVTITDNKEQADNIVKIYSGSGWNSNTQVEEFLIVNQKTKHSMKYSMKQMEVIM